MRPGVLVVSLATLLAAHAAGGAVSAPPQTVVSADGALTVRVPAGATSQRVHVRKLRASAYDLGPSGLRFAKPVTLTWRIDATKAGFDLKRAVPGIVLASRDSRGRWERLAQQQLRVDGTHLLVSGTTRHLSLFVAGDSGLRVAFAPDSVTKQDGQSWRATIGISSTSGRKDEFRLQEVRWRASNGAVKDMGDAPPSGDADEAHAYGCSGAGTGEFGAAIEVADETPAQVFADILTADTRPALLHVFVYNPARCTKPAVVPLSLAAACVLVTHLPFGSFPSFLTFVLQFLPSSLPAEPVLQLSAGGVNDGSPVSTPVDATGRARVDAGISSFGAKPIVGAAVNGLDFTSQLVGKIGPSLTVSSQQGTIAGTCP